MFHTNSQSMSADDRRWRNHENGVRWDRKQADARFAEVGQPISMNTKPTDATAREAIAACMAQQKGQP